MPEQSSLWFFEDVDLYEVLCPHRTSHLADTHTFHYYKKGDYIYFPDQSSSHIFLIAEGRVRIGSYTSEGKEVVKSILGPGEIFGELALTGESRRPDFAQAMDAQVTVCPLTIEEMEGLMKENKPLNFKVFRIMGMRLRRLERRVESLVFKDARTRIIEFLYDMAAERGKKAGFETLIKNHFTHKDIASLTGTSRQTVTTILNELRDKNLINFDRRRILIRDMEELKAEISKHY